MSTLRFDDYATAHQFTAGDLDGDAVGEVVRFVASHLPGVEGPVPFDVTVAGRIATIGHATESTTIGIALDDGNAYLFTLPHSRPVMVLEYRQPDGEREADSNPYPDRETAKAAIQSAYTAI